MPHKYCTIDRRGQVSAAFARIETDGAAFSYQPKDRKSVGRARRGRFDLDSFLERDWMDLFSTLGDTFRFKIGSLGKNRALLWCACGIKASDNHRVKD
jgi:hypothetical protein